MESVKLEAGSSKPEGLPPQTGGALSSSKLQASSFSMGVAADFALRMLRSTDLRLIWKFAYNFGYKGMRSVEKFKARLKQGVHFPPFLYISITNGCNLR